MQHMLENKAERKQRDRGREHPLRRLRTVAVIVAAGTAVFMVVIVAAAACTVIVAVPMVVTARAVIVAVPMVVAAGAVIVAVPMVVAACAVIVLMAVAAARRALTGPLSLFLCHMSHTLSIIYVHLFIYRPKE